MKKTDKFIPVITVVVYYGEKAREGVTTLHEMLDIPEKMMEFVNDYKMLLIEAKEKAIQYCEEHNTEKSVIMAVAAATNLKLDYNSLEEGDGRMCTVFDEIAKEGEAKGIIEIGFEFGLSENDILSRLQKKLDVSLQMAQEYLKMFGKQTV